MKKEKLMIFAAILLLGSCTTNGESSSEKENSEEITSSDVVSSASSKDVTPAKAKFTLAMNGNLHLNQSRSIYAILKEGVTGNVVFESSNPNIIRASKMEGISNEAF